MNCLPSFERQLAAGVSGAQTADGERRPAERAVPPRQPPLPLGLPVGVGAGVDASRELQAGREFVGRFVAKKALADGMAAVIWRRLRVKQAGGLEKTALREVLATGAANRTNQVVIARAAAPAR